MPVRLYEVMSRALRPRDDDARAPLRIRPVFDGILAQRGDGGRQSPRILARGGPSPSTIAWTRTGRRDLDGEPRTLVTALPSAAPYARLDAPLGVERDRACRAVRAEASPGRRLRPPVKPAK